MEFRTSHGAAERLGLTLEYAPVHTVTEINNTLDAMSRDRVQALLAFPSGLIYSQLKGIAEFAAKKLIPTMSGWKDFAIGGNLITYGPDLDEAWRTAATYVDKILKGQSPPTCRSSCLPSTSWRSISRLPRPSASKSRKRCSPRRRGDRMRAPRVHHASRRRGDAWPLAARAQQAGKLPTIGFLGAARLRPGVHGLPHLCSDCANSAGSRAAPSRSSIAGRRDAPSASPRSRPSSSALKVDVIVTSGTAVPAAKQATSVIPIVFAVADDPVGSGLVASLARPGGNVTGLSIQADRSCRQASSNSCARLSPVFAGWRSWPMSAIPPPCWRWARFRPRPARSASKSSPLEIRRAEDIAPAFEALKGRADALYVVGDPLLNDQPHSHQHLGARRAAADDLQLPRSMSKPGV